MKTSPRTATRTPRLSSFGRVERAAIYAVLPTPAKYSRSAVRASSSTLGISTPNGTGSYAKTLAARCQHYYRPKMELVSGTASWQVEQLTFRTEWNGKSYRESTYGGKLVENACRRSRGTFSCVGGLNAEAAGYPSIMLVHDSNVTMPLKGHGSPEELTALMCAQEPWITDLPLAAEAGRMERYG
jgi:hypothetical protein